MARRAHCRSPADRAAPSAPADAVVPVSLFVSSARLIIERHLGLAWISGEISGFSRAASGHCYFTLKDDRAQVRCVLFRNKAQLLSVALKDGLAVEVRATPTIYEARGDFQLSVDTVRLAGLGALYERFAKLKAKLDAAGWFKPERKRALPRVPARHRHRDLAPRGGAARCPDHARPPRAFAAGHPVSDAGARQ